MKAGDLVEIPLKDDKTGVALVVKVWDFSEYCDQFDERSLEYDIDEAWEHWQESGLLIDIIHPERNVIVSTFGWQ